MDRFAAMVVLLGVLVSVVLILLALFAVAPIICSCLISLIYSLYLFMAYEESGVHHAQEFENRFWTIFGLLLSTALFFAKDSPMAFGIWSPSLGFVAVLISGYCMHVWDRYVHRIAMSQSLYQLRRNFTGLYSSSTSLTRLKDLGIPVEEQLKRINDCLHDIDQLLIPSTINNLINQTFVFRKEKEIISVFEECDARALNYLISHVKLGLLFYKIKDHRNFTGQHRSQLIKLLAVDRLSILTIMPRVIVLYALQLLKLRANPSAEYWVRNIILNTSQDELSELKTLTDGKGDYFCMTKLIYDDIRSQTIRQDILNHLRKEATIQSSLSINTKRWKKRQRLAWRKVLSDVDDTLYCSGGSYPAGIDRSYGKKVVYPGVLAFYRELDLGTQGPEEWPDNRVGNLVFLSARPHVYKDISEKINFAKFEKLRTSGLHTIPSLLTGDLSSGGSYIVRNDFEPLAKKKYDNFKRYVSIYPEYTHIFVCDNGQGDVRAAEMMFDNFPYEFDGQGVYVHKVQPMCKTYGYKPDIWANKGFRPYFFRTYPEAALHAASKRNPPLIRYTGLRRVCVDAAKDFISIPSKKWKSMLLKAQRRRELNQAIWSSNMFLISRNVEPVELIKADRLWVNGQKVKTPYGIAIIKDFDPIFDLYKVELDWRPLNIQLENYLTDVRNESILPKSNSTNNTNSSNSVSSDNNKAKSAIALETVVEIEEIEEQACEHNTDKSSSQHEQQRRTSLDDEVSSEVDTSISARQTITYKKLKEIDSDDESNFSSMTPSVDTRNNNIQSSAMLTNVQTPPSSTPRSSIIQKQISSFSGTDECSISAQSTNGSILTTTTAVETATNTSENVELTTATTHENKCASGGAIKGGAYATIAGHLITKYSPPTLPKIEKTIEKTRGSIFTFWSPSASHTKKKKEKEQRSCFKPGDECRTPYGLATIVQHRNESDGLVIVKMIGWKAHGYLREADIEIIESGTQQSGIFGSLLQKFSSVKDKDKDKDKEKELIEESLFEQGVEIHTPFGKGCVTRTLQSADTELLHKSTYQHQQQQQHPSNDEVLLAGSVSRNTDADNDIQATSNVGDSSLSSPNALSPTPKPATTGAIIATANPSNSINTLGIALSDWKLANGKHPMLYCTLESAKEWKKQDFSSSQPSQDGIFSKISKLVPFLSTTNKNTKAIALADSELVDSEPSPKFEQYYLCAAAVSTQFGDGVVKNFRSVDGFYEVNLIRWALANGKHPVVYLRRDDIGYRIAKNCKEGYPVLTSYGMTGNLASVQPTTGVHIVTVPSAGLVCYLQPDFILCPLKAAVGEGVLTPYGEGKVIKYRIDDDMYAIDLYNCNATLYAKAETFSRVSDGTQDVNGQFGMSWLLQFFFSTDKASTTATNRTRSRSNSIVTSVSGAVGSYVS